MSTQRSEQINHVCNTIDKTAVFTSTDDSDVIGDQTNNDNQTTGNGEYVDMIGEPTVTSAEVSTSWPGDAYVTYITMSDKDVGRTYMNVQESPEFGSIKRSIKKPVSVIKLI